MLDKIKYCISLDAAIVQLYFLLVWHCAYFSVASPQLGQRRKAAPIIFVASQHP